MVEDVDRRHGTCRRRLPCEFRDAKPEVPWTRHYRPTALLGSHARPVPEIDRAIPADFVFGLPTRNIGGTLLSLPSAVSRVAKTPDATVTAFHGLLFDNATWTHCPKPTPRSPVVPNPVGGAI